MMQKMPYSWLKVAAVSVTVLIGTGCKDLSVANPNEPDRGRALNDALAVESLIAGSFKTWWDMQQGPTTRWLSCAGQTTTSSALNYGSWDACWQPARPVPNQAGYVWGYAIEEPFLFVNRASAGIRDGLLMIKDGLKIGTNGADTPRLQAFAKFMLGLNHAYIAQRYDQGWIIDETVDVEASLTKKDLRPYGELMKAALAYLEEARQIASRNPFSTPSVWMQSSYTSANLIRLTHSLEARYLATVARTPEQRAAVDWGAVLTHIQLGVTSDFGIQQDGPGGMWDANLKNMSTLTGGVALNLLGPADQSGRWQNWLSKAPRDRAWFLVETDDRRIHGPGGPEASGTLFQIRKNASGQIIVYNDAERGLWLQTPYSSYAWRSFAETEFGFTPELTLKEMDFLRAEAYIRLGQPNLALPIINKTRVENGKLPPATVSGVSGTRCVPRKPTGQCGDLMDALIYEKRLETLWLSGGLDFYDARAFGRVAHGHARHLPVPAYELQALKLPIYTFGGEAGNGVPGLP